MFCERCGKELSEESLYCGNCGASLKTKEKTNNTLSIIGFVVGIISLFLNFWGLVGIAAVIISSMGLIQVNKSGEKGKALAMSGVIIGAFSIIYGLMMILQG
jgi:hypothetical protein